ncbi:MAG: hypothetical protein FWD31_05425 [Planctomycetaceae bacterium]|nr:hypothetical protein [Planctomycetaceae bacterium]
MASVKQNRDDRNANPVIFINPADVALKSDDSYDRFASLLTSLLILASISTTILLGLWLSTGLAKKKTSTAVHLGQLGELGGLGEDRRLDPEVVTPGMEIEFDEPTFADALEQVAETIADQSSLLTNPAQRSDSVLTVGAIRGDGLAPGEGTGRLGQRRHWEVQFHDQRSLQAYAQQLDDFKIELAILQPGGNVMYFSRLANPMPSIRQEPAANEQRYYLTWLRPELQSADRELIAKTGITVGEKQIIMKFLPPELEQRLAQLERETAGNRLPQLRATYFTVRQVNRGFEFVVSRQTF